jgi:CelD/BcsL family acetyltransferase involved in cellulose biosynthesis
MSATAAEPFSDELVAGWEALAAGHATLPTQDLPWALASVDAFGGQPSLFPAERAAALEAIAPVVRQGGHLALFGHEMYEPNDLLGVSAGAVAELAARLVADRTALVLSRIPADSGTPVALSEAVGRRGLVRVAPMTAHPEIELDERWQELGGGLSSSRRSALRRSRRRAEKVGEVSVELLAPHVDEVPALLDQAFAIEARSWKGEAGTALAQDAPRAAFIRRYAIETAARGTLRLQFLKFGDEWVAMQIGVEWKEQLWLLKIGYDAAHSVASPGQLLLAESIADAARRGLRGYQLLGEAAAWTRVWSSGERASVTVRVYPASTSGAIAFVGDARTVLERGARRGLGEARRSTAEKVSSRYLAGPALADAVATEAGYAAAGYRTTVGFWGDADTSPKEVRGEYFDAAAALPPGSELAIKLPALGSDKGCLDELLDRCVERGLGLHLDALAPEAATASLEMALHLHERAPGVVGCTLTGRWRRSPDDARLLAGSGLNIRVVKSEWPDPGDPRRDAVAGYREVIERLAGAAGRVEVATHDAPLAAAALDRLAGTSTEHELQVLHATNGRRAVRAARRRGVPVRVYVPYGVGRVPYPTGGLVRHPAVAAKVGFDLLPVRPLLSRRLVLLGDRR